MFEDFLENIKGQELFKFGVKDESIELMGTTMQANLNTVLKNVFINTLIIVAFILIVSYLLFVKYK